MSCIRATGRQVVLAALLIWLPACSKTSSTGQGDNAAANTESELTDIGDILRLVAHEGKNPPAQLKELQEATAAAPPGVAAVEEGRIVLNWRYGIRAGSSAILAYEKNVPQSGGFVLLQDGTIKKLSAAEFKSSPALR